MKRSYQSPFIWIPVAMSILFAIMGQILTTTISSDTKYLFYIMKPGGLLIAGMFTLCAVANFLGNRFVTNKPFVQKFPTKMIAVTAIMAVLSIFLAAVLSAENKVANWIVLTAAGMLFISFPTACFIRGMAPPSATDR